MVEKIGTIHAPNKNGVIPEHAQWLGGIGAGTWFCIDRVEDDVDLFRIRRYGSEGLLECDTSFKTSSSEFNIERAYSFTYISHCKICKILQNGTVFVFNSIT